MKTKILIILLILMLFSTNACSQKLPNENEFIMDKAQKICGNVILMIGVGMNDRLNNSPYGYSLELLTEKTIYDRLANRISKAAYDSGYFNYYRYYWNKSLLKQKLLYEYKVCVVKTVKFIKEMRRRMYGR